MSSDTYKPLFINGRFLTQETTGVQKFAFEVARELMQAPFNATVLVPKNSQHPEMEQMLRVEQVGSLTGHLWEQMELGYAVRKRGGYLLNLANTGPLNFSPQALVLHDAAFRVNPDWFSKKFSAGYNMLIPKLVEGADLLVTVSDSAARDIQHYFKVPERAPLVIHNGVCSSFIEHENTRTSEVMQVEAQLGSKMFLAVSSMNPRKNFLRLVRAFNQVLDPEAQLVLTGAGHRAFADSKLEREIANDPRIVLRGYVSNEELVALYRKAIAFVYPSLYEGFGLPVLEAMHFGCPVAASDIPVFNELFGNSFISFNPKDEDAIAARMNELLERESLRAELSKKGRETASKYRYSISTKILMDALELRLKITE